MAGADLVVTTYATAARDVDDLAPVAGTGSCSTRPRRSRTRSRVVAHRARCLDAEHRVALTGTPVENRLAELWSVMDVLNPGLLGSPERFRNRFAVPIERHGDAEAAAQLRRITRPYLLRRVKTDPEVIDDLPEKIEITQHYRLTREQASLYRTVVDDMMEKIEDQTASSAAATCWPRWPSSSRSATTRRSCCTTAPRSPIRRPPASGKIIRLEELLGEILAEGDRVLCFTQFTEFAAMLVPHLSARFDTEVAFLHGGTSKTRRDEMVTRFQAPDGPSVFLLSLKAGGTGLTLTAANHVVHLDRWWNPAVENQATDRAFRIGQKRSVQVRKFCCPGTVEERIEALIESKKALSGMVVSDGEGWLTELSTGELREVFALGEDAVAEGADADA